MSKEDVLLFGTYGMRGTGKSYYEKLKEKDKEIERLTAESTKWESKFYDEAKKVDRAIEYIEERKNLNWYAEGVFVYELLNILQGVDKE